MIFLTVAVITGLACRDVWRNQPDAQFSDITGYTCAASLAALSGLVAFFALYHACRVVRILIEGFHKAANRPTQQRRLKAERQRELDSYLEDEELQ
jgi:hypothetical protein